MELIQYQVVSPDEADVEELLGFYRRLNHETTQSADKLRRMIALSDCMVTARAEGRLVGMARGLSDGVRGYFAECKLDPAFQGPGAVTRTDGRVEHDERGIAREMAGRILEHLREQGVECVQVIAHGTEEDFCADLGFKRTRGAVAMQMDWKGSPAGASPVGRAEVGRLAKSMAASKRPEEALAGAAGVESAAEA